MAHALTTQIYMVHDKLLVTPETLDTEFESI